MECGQVAFATGMTPIDSKNASASLARVTPYLVDAAAEINRGIDRNKKVLVEGTQGLGLSLYHSDAYPKTTSRDTSAAGCISECGISPLSVTSVVLVLRTFPIRVAGPQAGPMFQEIDWETVRRESGYPCPVAEYTTVTRKLRRVGRFDLEVARRAAEINRPSRIALNFLDYVSYSNRSLRDWNSLTPEARELVEDLERVVGAPATYLGTGPGLQDCVVRASTSQQTLQAPLVDRATFLQTGTKIC